VPPLAEIRRLMQRRYDLFLAAGDAALTERQHLTQQLHALQASAGAQFPLSPGDTTALLAHVRDQVLALHTLESAAVQALEAALR
jgi:hypothetical protein